MDSVLIEKVLEGMLNKSRQGSEPLTAQYAAMFESIENLDERRQSNNTVYTTINTALIALVAASLSLIVTNLTSPAGIAMSVTMFGLVPAVGISICNSWEQTLTRYKDLRNGKFKTLDLVESLLPLNLNKAEWEILKSRNYTTASETATLPGHMKKVYYILIAFGVVLTGASLLSMAGMVSLRGPCFGEPHVPAGKADP